jgi:hypothetical protein
MIAPSSTRPAIQPPVLSIGEETYAPWNDYFLDRGNYDWGDAGVQMISGIPHVFTWPNKPSASDPFVTADGVTVPALKKYPTLAATAAQLADNTFDVRHLPLAKDSEANLRADIASWEREHDKFSKDDIALLLDLYSSVSPESMMVAKACPEHAVCMALPVGARSLAFRNILIATHSTGDARTRLHRCSQLFQTKQGDMTHEKFRALVDTRFKAVDNTFSVPGEPLYWNKFEIKTAIYLFGLREHEYAMPLEALLTANPNGRMSDSTKIMDNMQLWVNNHRTTLGADPVSLQLALAAVNHAPAKTVVHPSTVQQTQKKPCHVCISHGRTENAKRHTADVCFINKASHKFNQALYDKVVASKQRTMDSSSVTPNVTASTNSSSISSKKGSSSDRHLRALIALHDEADTPERKISALAAVSDYAAMMANGAESGTGP